MTLDLNTAKVDRSDDIAFCFQRRRRLRWPSACAFIESLHRAPPPWLSERQELWLDAILSELEGGS